MLYSHIANKGLDANSLNQLSSLARKLVGHFKHSTLAMAVLKTKARANECPKTSSYTRCGDSLEFNVSDVSTTTRTKVGDLCRFA